MTSMCFRTYIFGEFFLSTYYTGNYKNENIAKKNNLFVFEFKLPDRTNLPITFT